MRRYAAPIVAALAAAGFLAGGIFELVVQRTGEPARATIVSCDDVPGKYGGSTCKGTWVAGGSLLDGGHVVIGTVDGAGRSDLHKTIDVRLAGGRAYTTSLRVPIVLLVLGLAFAAVAARTVVGLARPPEPPAVPT